MSLTEKEETVIITLNNYYKSEMKKLKEIIQQKDEKIKELETQIMYQPEGPGAIQAEEHFNSLQKNNFPDDNFEDQNEKNK